MKNNTKTHPRIKDIKPMNGIKFTKQNVSNLTDHINKCEIWIEGFEQEVQDILDDAKLEQDSALIECLLEILGEAS